MVRVMIVPEAPDEQVVLATKWFRLVARRMTAQAEPHYSIRSQDYVHVVALDTQGQLLLVRQFRPAVGQMTLELPSGHVEPDQTPEQAARAELLEETGHVADQFELLGDCWPDTGRLSNRLWYYFAGDVRPTTDPSHQPEAGIDFVRYPGTVRQLLEEKSFSNGLNRAGLLAAILKGKLKT